MSQENQTLNNPICPKCGGALFKDCGIEGDEYYEDWECMDCDYCKQIERSKLKNGVIK